jgi:hypothetical protein
LWASPLKHLIEAFQAISLHLHSGSIPYFGVSIPNNALPWHYLPVWIGISTPFLYVVFFCIGGLSTCYEIVRYKFKIFQNQDQLIDLILMLKSYQNEIGTINNAGNVDISLVNL